MQREDVERISLSAGEGEVLVREIHRLTERAIKAEAERDAAFASGQEDMRERAAAVCDKWSSTISPETDGSTGADLCETGIRDLPIKPRP